MKLKSARVRMFRNIVDSGEVCIDDDITVLVGKNESGKSSFLDALYRLNPAYTEPFSELDDYPRWRRRRDARDSDLAAIQPIAATFEATDEDRAAIRARLGLDVPLPRDFTLGRTYGDQLLVELDQEAIVDFVLADTAIELPGDAPKDLPGLSVYLDALPEAEPVDGVDDEAGGPGEPDPVDAARRMVEVLNHLGSAEATIGAVVGDLLPTFFRFNTWSHLPARIQLSELVSAEPDDLPPEMRTALSLVTMSGGTADEFLGEDYETRVAELEASANEITRQIFDYWTQNDTLEVDFDAEYENEETPQGQRSVITHLQVRIRDRRHQMTTSFGVRSTGFQWFFSFLAAFYEYESRDDIVVLLDEPGLGLHGRAQGDFLRFISEKLASKHQVLYTTHSPFMVRPGHLEGIRLVEDDEDLEVAATVTGEIRVRDSDTLFPLQAALGYDIAQALFVAGHNLIVEGVSDYIYLTTLSDHLATVGRTSLDEHWNVLPVGGVSKIPTFVALLGAHLDITVLIDSSPGPNERLSNLAARGLLDETRIVSIAQELGRSNVDMEDMFTPGEYVKLYNTTFGTDLRVSDLTGSDGIVRKLERHRGSSYDHADPAVAMLRQRDSFLTSLRSGTLDRFEALFSRVNGTSA